MTRPTTRRAAQVWIGLVLAAGCGALAIALASLIEPRWRAELQSPTLWIFLIAASIAHAFPVIAPRHQAYHTTQAFLMAAVLLLGWPAVSTIVIVTHIAEWLRRRRPWYIQLYNVAVYLLSAGSAMAILWQLNARPFDLGDGRALLAALGAAGAFLLVNHLLTAVVLRLARGVSVADSGLFGPQSLGVDGALLLVGVAMAGAWTAQPAAVIVAGAPLALIYRALRMANVETISHRDALTGLYNARHFEEVLELELRRARHGAQPTAVIVAALDDAAMLVQRYGRATLDFVVLAVAERIGNLARDYDVVARLGESSLGVLLPGVDEHRARRVACHILDAAAAEPFGVATTREPVSASVSVALASQALADVSAEHILVSVQRAVERAVLTGARAFVQVQVERSATTAPVRSVAASGSGAMPTATITHARSRWWSAHLNLPQFEAAVIVPGLAVTGLATVLWEPIDVGLAVAILGIVAVSELLAFDLYDRTSFSVSFALILAAGLLGGPTAALVATWSVAILRGCLRRSRWDKVLFNGSVFSLFGLAATASAAVVGGLAARSTDLATLVIATMVASAAYYVHTFVIAAAVSLDLDTDPRLVWTRNFRWLFPHYLVLGAMGLGLAVATLDVGMLGATLFLAPLLMMRFVLKQYIDRTAGAVERLEAANAELIAASSLLRRRGEKLALLSDLGQLTAIEPRAASLPALVADRCVPALGEVCAVVWQGPSELEWTIRGVPDAQAVALAMRAQGLDEVANLAESVVGGGARPDWTRSLNGVWHAARLARPDRPKGWLITWTGAEFAHGEVEDQGKLLCEVARRLALVLEHEALLEEAASVEALRAVDRAKSDFVAITAHELRTPLTSLQGYAELLSTEVEPGLRERWLRIVQVEAAQLGQVLDHLLDVSRLDSGRFHADRRPFDLREVVNRVLAEFGNQAALTGHDLRCELAPELPPAFADPTQIERVIRNLLSNALKYSPQGGDVWLAAASRPTELEVCVQDEGLGIPSDWLGRLFERFQRVDMPDRATIRGTGLGLYIARQLVEMNGGRIWATSDGVGRGASFRFTLAMAPPRRLS
jgi:diguanylate cyclase (GGDEF)-like protein